MPKQNERNAPKVLDPTAAKQICPARNGEGFKGQALGAHAGRQDASNEKLDDGNRVRDKRE